MFSSFVCQKAKTNCNNGEFPAEQTLTARLHTFPTKYFSKFQIKSKLKFKLPSLDLLKSPSKDERSKQNKNENNDPEFLEKILLDFGVNGNIKKVSHGPVVTLNEFEPAAGVKVSKIINLSDDIARNTSSESARISTIPGSNTIGIELPNDSRENVYLSEILNNSDFKKTSHKNDQAEAHIRTHSMHYLRPLQAQENDLIYPQAYVYAVLL